MSGQHRDECEPLRAVGALERPLACVNSKVFDEHEAEREPFAALVTLVRPLPRVSGKMPLYIGPPSVRLVAMWAFKLTLHLMHLSVLGACKQGVESFAALLADVTLSSDVRLPVLEEFGGSWEALAADGADLRELGLLRVRFLVVERKGSKISEGAPT